MTLKASDLPLDGNLVLDLSHFLAGPLAALRLADLGARVIKVERPDGGDPSRSLLLRSLKLDGDSVIFHAVNRNKESFVADLKDTGSLDRVLRLAEHADVIIESFRPGTADRLGLGYEALRMRNPGIVYATVSGYGPSGPWRDRPGQDLLVQGLTGLPWLNGGADDPPTAFGLSVIDTLAGEHLCAGIVAALLRRQRSGRGARVEVSLLESALALQFEVLTAHLNDGGKRPERSTVYPAHPYAAAPYGVYPTRDSFIALAMGSIPALGAALDEPDLCDLTEPAQWYEQRDSIKRRIAVRLLEQTTAAWIEHLLPAGIWAAEVLQMDEVVAADGVAAVAMIQPVRRRNGQVIRTVRSPLRIDGEPLGSPKGAPALGEHDDLPSG